MFLIGFYYTILLEFFHFSIFVYLVLLYNHLIKSRKIETFTKYSLSFIRQSYNKCDLQLRLYLLNYCLFKFDFERLYGNIQQIPESIKIKKFTNNALQSYANQIQHPTVLQKQQKQQRQQQQMRSPLLSNTTNKLRRRLSDATTSIGNNLKHHKNNNGTSNTKFQLIRNSSQEHDDHDDTTATSVTVTTVTTGPNHADQDEKNNDLLLTSDNVLRLDSDKDDDDGNDNGDSSSTTSSSSSSPDRDAGNKYRRTDGFYNNFSESCSHYFDFKFPFSNGTEYNGLKNFRQDCFEYDILETIKIHLLECVYFDFLTEFDTWAYDIRDISRLHERRNRISSSPHIYETKKLCLNWRKLLLYGLLPLYIISRIFNIILPLIYLFCVNFEAKSSPNIVCIIFWHFAIVYVLLLIVWLVLSLLVFLSPVSPILTKLFPQSIREKYGSYYYIMYYLRCYYLRRVYNPFHVFSNNKVNSSIANYNNAKFNDESNIDSITTDCTFEKFWEDGKPLLFGNTAYKMDDDEEEEEEKKDISVNIDSTNTSNTNSNTNRNTNTNTNRNINTTTTSTGKNGGNVVGDLNMLRSSARRNLLTSFKRRKKRKRRRREVIWDSAFDYTKLTNEIQFGCDKYGFENDMNAIFNNHLFRHNFFVSFWYLINSYYISIYCIKMRNMIGKYYFNFGFYNQSILPYLSNNFENVEYIYVPKYYQRHQELVEQMKPNDHQHQSSSQTHPLTEKCISLLEALVADRESNENDTGNDISDNFHEEKKMQEINDETRIDLQFDTMSIENKESNVDHLVVNSGDIDVDVDNVSNAATVGHSDGDGLTEEMEIDWFDESYRVSNDVMSMTWKQQRIKKLVQDCYKFETGQSCPYIEQIGHFFD